MDATRRRLLQAHLDELERWNARINLTSIAPEQAWAKHVEESIALLDACTPRDGARVIDVGTGGGVPGVPVAILRPDLRVTLLDSDRRKAAFLTHVAGALQLRNVEVLDTRAEDAAHRQGLRESFDHAMSRALAPSPVMCELLLPFVAVGGTLATLVADAAQAARQCAQAAQVLGGAEPRTAPGEVLLVDKVQPTPAQYPRRAGVPVRRPL